MWYPGDSFKSAISLSKGVSYLSESPFEIGKVTIMGVLLSVNLVVLEGLAVYYSFLDVFRVIAGSV